MIESRNVIIGFGKAGKTLAKSLAANGEQVILIEKSDQMYGGTCINVGCLPSKALILDGERNVEFTKAMERKTQMVEKLRSKNYHLIADEDNVEVWNGVASFESNYELKVAMADGETRYVKGERIIVDTGSTSVIPNIKGLKISDKMIVSNQALNLEKLPKSMVILGVGYIGLEFAQMYASFGTKITMIGIQDEFIPREDRDIADMIWKDMHDMGIEIHLAENVEELEETATGVNVKTDKDTYQADVVLIATGRRPNTDDLALENTNIKLGSRGEIEVNEKLQTTVDNIWAVGDVKGGLQFTYVSLDDYRIVNDQLLGQGERTTANRPNIPYSVFINPPLSNVGMNEEQAKKSGQKYQIYKQIVTGIPRAQVTGDTRGLMKIIVNPETDMILGATLYSESSHEMINLITLAMNEDIPFTKLKQQIYTHPTMSETLNTIFN